MATHERHTKDAGVLAVPRGPIQRAERFHGNMFLPHEFLNQLRQRLVPEVANIKSLQQAIEDSAPGTGQAFMPAIGSANATTQAWDQQPHQGGMTYGSMTPFIKLLKPNKKKGGKKLLGRTNEVGDGGADGVLAAINERMWAFVSDSSTTGPLCLDKYGKARRKTVRELIITFTCCGSRFSLPIY